VTVRVVQAAGGVPWRVDDQGRVEVLVVQRPRLDDWSLPKGKRERTDPDDEHCAIREVEEETGYRCSLGRELPSIDYVDRKGRHKHVRYWEMRPVSGEGAFAPTWEVGGIRWLLIKDAMALLTYDNDKRVLAAFASFAGHDERATG
jgi:8-oxo-dGTP pyrophosphatase MutT (NUDIX family)